MPVSASRATEAGAKRRVALALSVADGDMGACEGCTTSS
jgi:hypothetical protein